MHSGRPHDKGADNHKGPHCCQDEMGTTSAQYGKAPLASFRVAQIFYYIESRGLGTRVEDLIAIKVAIAQGSSIAPERRERVLLAVKTK